MNYNNILGVPTQAQIEGFYGDEIVSNFFIRATGPKGEQFQCQCCKNFLTLNNCKAKLKYHLQRHIAVAESPMINNFEKTQNPDKLACKTCHKEIFLKHVLGHSDSCQRKTVRPAQRKVLVVYREAGQHGFSGSLLEKRPFDEHEEAYRQEDMEMDYEEEVRNGELEENDREKIQKKVKRENMATSLNGREPTSLKNILCKFMEGNRHLRGRDLKYEMEKIIEPFEKQWNEDKKKLMDEISELREGRDEDRERMQKLVEKLEKIEKEKDQCDEMMRNNIKLEITKEFEDKLEDQKKLWKEEFMNLKGLFTQHEQMPEKDLSSDC